MRILKLRNRILQLLYRPPGAFRRFTIPAQTLTVMDELDKAIQKKITPLLTGLWEE